MVVEATEDVAEAIVGDSVMATVTAITPITGDMAGWWGYPYWWDYRYYPYYYSFKPET